MPAEKNNPLRQPHAVRLTILADDLTGALDSGVEFANRGFKVTVATSAGQVERALSEHPDILVINTASRELGANAAREIHRSLRKHLRTAGLNTLFKKVDSRLKGNIVEEINGLLSGDQPNLLIAPAIPDMGRVHRDGLLTGEGIETPIDMRARFKGLVGDKSFPDIANQADFSAIVAPPSDSILYIGAKGLASALAQLLASDKDGAATFANTEKSKNKATSPLSGPLLAAIGSRDPITLSQIDSLVTLDSPHFTHVQAPNGHPPKGIPPPQTSLLLQITQGQEHENSLTVNERFAAQIRNFMLSKQYPILFACGGQTAQDIITILNVGVLEIQGELFSGVPVSKAVFDSRAFSLITKSGGFGKADLLANLFQLIQEPNLRT